MAMLTSELIISLIDQVSGPAEKIKASLTGMQRLDQMGARLQQTGKNLTTSFTAPIALGLGLAAAHASKFEESMKGVSLAMLDGGDFASVSKQLGPIAEKTNIIRQNIMAISSQMGVLPDKLAESAALFTKAGITDPNLLNAFLKGSAVMNIVDPQTSGEENARMLNSFRTLFGAQTPDQVIEEAGRVALATKHSKYSLGEFEMGMQRFMPLGQAMGMGTADIESLLAGGSQGGVNADKMSTAIRTMLGKMLSPDQGSYAVLSKLGIDRAKYMDLTQQLPSKTVQLLSSEYQGKLNKHSKAELTAMLEQAQKTGTATSQQFVDAFSQRFSEMIGAKTSEDIAQAAGRVDNALFAPGGKVDVFGMLKALKDSGATPADLNQLFNPRQGSNVQAILANLQYAMDLRDKLANPGQVIGGIGAINDANLNGQLTRLQASWDRLLNTIGNSGAIQGVVSVMNSLADAMASIKPETMSHLVQGLIALAAVGPGLWIAGSAMRLMALAGAGIGLLRVPMTIAGVANGAPLAAVGVARLASSFRLLRFAMLGLAGVAAYELVTNADQIKDFLASPILASAGNTINEGFEKLKSTLSDIAHSPWVANIRDGLAEAGSWSWGKLVEGFDALKSGLTAIGNSTEVKALMADLGALGSAWGNVFAEMTSRGNVKDMLDGSVEAARALTHELTDLGQFLSNGNAKNVLLGISEALIAIYETVKLLSTLVGGGFAGLHGFVSELRAAAETDTNFKQIITDLGTIFNFGSNGNYIADAFRAGKQSADDLVRTLERLKIQLDHIAKTFSDLTSGKWSEAWSDLTVPTPWASSKKDLDEQLQAAELAAEMKVAMGLGRGGAADHEKPGPRTWIQDHMGPDYGGEAPTNYAPRADQKAIVDGITQGAQAAPAVVSGAVAQVNGILKSGSAAAFAAGKAYASQLAAGIRAGIPEIAAAASAAAGAASRGAVAGAFSDGGSR